MCKAQKPKERALMILYESSKTERKERIANGTWMGRGCVMHSGKEYNRSAIKRECRKAVYE